jgi:hypothetical protein
MKTLTWIGLTVGNFLWQATFGGEDWLRAAGLSGYQGAAFFALWLIERALRRSAVEAGR